MGKNTEITDQARAYKRASGNPYAFLGILDEDDVEVLHAPTDEQKHSHLQELQNPYAYIELFAEEEGKLDEFPTHEKVQSVPSGPIGKLSKKEFQAKCRRIFMQYVPSEGRRVLRSHHRDFVVRNESRPADERFLLVAELSKYDLSSSVSYRPHFNREEKDILTIKKLRDIEKKINS